MTGGCGFIGSHLVRHLANAGANVVALDSLKYGARETPGAVEVAKFRLGTDSRADLSRWVAKTDYIFHLAAEKHNQSRDNPRELLQSNVNGTIDLLELAAEHGVKKIVFSSSLYAYGRLMGPRMREDEPASPRTLYGLSKLMGEQLLGHYGIEHVTLRYFFVYGPRQFAGMGYKSVIVKNFERILAGKNPVIFGDGQQALDYVYVDDVIRATVQALESAVSGEVLNVGSSVPTTIVELTDLMLRAAGSDLKPVHEPPDWTAGSNRTGDTAKIRQLLHWTPSVPLPEGLARTLEWMKGKSHEV